MSQEKKANEFNIAIQEAKHLYYRDMPWRQKLKGDNETAYKVLVSEMMLQQTQVLRVVPKYSAFLERFPTIESLAKSDRAEVLRLWNGLGYNRRASYVHEAAQTLIACRNEWTLQNLTSCKGIGPNTAAVVRVYAYNAPEVFVETNIRTVMIHYFYDDQQRVTDAQILHTVAENMDNTNPRSWYWALMDEGARLKAANQAHLIRSSVYKKQSKFEGSRRQIRGIVIKLLTNGPQMKQLVMQKCNDPRTEDVLLQLHTEGLISSDKELLYLGNAK